MGYLCLSRRVREKVIINNEKNEKIVIAVLGGGGEGNVRLAFDAPENFNIVREEISDESRRNKIENEKGFNNFNNNRIDHPAKTRWM